MTNMNQNQARQFNGGAKTYHCIWNDYHSSNFLDTWMHSIKCGAGRGYFDLPVALVKTAVAINGGWALSLIKKFTSK